MHKQKYYCHTVKHVTVFCYVFFVSVSFDGMTSLHWNLVTWQCDHITFLLTHTTASFPSLWQSPHSNLHVFSLFTVIFLWFTHVIRAWLKDCNMAVALICFIKMASHSREVSFLIHTFLKQFGTVRSLSSPFHHYMQSEYNGNSKYVLFGKRFAINLI